jgi:hypothetical protein
LKKNGACYRNLSLGLMTKARASQGAGQEGSPRITSHVPGSIGECGEWTFTFPSELPFWELESQWTLKPLESNLSSQNPLNWDVPYIIEKLLKCRCLKWAHMTRLDTCNTSYGQKKGRKPHFFSIPTFNGRESSSESPQFPWVQVACNILLKRSQWGLQWGL